MVFRGADYCPATFCPSFQYLTLGTSGDMAVWASMMDCLICRLCVCMCANNAKYQNNRRCWFRHFQCFYHCSHKGGGGGMHLSLGCAIARPERL